MGSAISAIKSKKDKNKDKNKDLAIMKEKDLDNGVNNERKRGQEK